MPTKRLSVLLALKAMIEAALPGALVLGLENEGAPPDRIPEGGRIVIRAGDPGEPEVFMSPLTYTYDHAIPVQIAVNKNQDAGVSAQIALDAVIKSISDVIAANRTLGGAVEFLDGYAPQTDDIFTAGSSTAAEAELSIVATYSTDAPL